MSRLVEAFERVERASRRSHMAHAFRLSRSFGPVELSLALLVLGAMAFAVLAPHLREGGFYLDDWSNAASSLQPPGNPDLGSAISTYADLTIYRPVLVLYVPLTYFVFGMHLHYHLALATLLAVFGGTMFYGVLRVIGMPWIHAGIVAALAILFPWSDSTLLWATAGQLSLSIFFMTAGLLIALVGLNRSAWRWHAPAAVLYLLSILTYEVTLPVVAFAGVLYCRQAGWRAARSRWAVDLVVVVVAGVWVAANTVRTASSVGAALEHLRQIISEGGMILGRAAVPLGSPGTGIVLAGLTVMITVGVAAYLRFPRLFIVKQGWGLGSWLSLTGGGLAIAALGWAVFIPADPYYTPTIFGEVNRVNSLAGFGLVLAVYGAFGILGTLAGQVRAKTAGFATAITVSLGFLLLASYGHVLRRHIEIWNRAFFAQTYALTKTKREIPVLPPGTTLFASSYPAYQAPGVPILATTWDFDGMIKMEYDDSSLSASPVLPELSLACKAAEVSLEREGIAEVTAAYGAVRLLNLETGMRSAPANQRQCHRVISSYVPGPLFLSPGY